MTDSDTTPNVNAIIQELREGMGDTEPLQTAGVSGGARRELKASLRKANETVDVLGRCGGSLRGKLCLQLARLALPVVEQLNAYHAATVAALTQLRDQQDASLISNAIPEDRIEARFAKLEAEVESLKRERHS